MFYEKGSNMRDLLIMILISGFSFSSGFGQSEPSHNCFTILVGKSASTDGSVFLAHNEDDLNDHNFVDLHKVPRIQHRPGEQQVFLNKTDSLDEIAETYGYFWITGSKYIEEQYVNEWGVAITSNSSQSKVQNGNGKIDHNLRRIVIERARTAREAVTIAGSIVDRFGYATSGRVYTIADPNEAWVLEVANGKHWIARRVPDDGVVIVPNYYVIDDFNQADTANFLSSPDLIDFAAANGWYDPHKEASFNFRNVYGHHNRLDATWNIARKWVILNRLSERQYDLHADFPFSIRPKHKIDIRTLIDALQNHYEHTAIESDPSLNNGSPHGRAGLGLKDTLPVCNIYNDYSCITQLRNWLPVGMANVLWISPRYPCLQPFIPWYYGINTIPTAYEQATYREALENFNNKNRDYIRLYPRHACWTFDDFANRVDSCYGKQIQSVREWKSKFQDEIMKTIAEKERDIAKVYDKDREKALQMLTDLTNGFAERVLRETNDKLVTMKASARE
jgi:dipeptidase